MGQPSRSGRHALAWIIVAILLAAALVGTLWVPFYARTTPKLGAFPFFYWYQLIWIPAVAILSWLAYLLTRRQTGQQRPDATTASTKEQGAGDGS